jgi:hypothetical protein
MGDYEGVPSKWDWVGSISNADLKTKLASSGSRLISIHRPDGGAKVALTAVWVANNGADKTDWDWTPGATAKELDSLVGNAKGRLIHIDAYNLTGKGLRFAAIWVTNTGSFQRPWDWHAGLTSAQLATTLGQSKRIISLTTYRQGNQRLYAAVWVSNTGTQHRDWDWAPSATFEKLRQKLEDFPGRLVSLDAFASGGKTLFAAAWVDSGDQFAKLWWWGVGQDEAAINMDLPLFCSYMVEARKLPGAPTLFNHFRHGFPRPAYKESASLVALSGSAQVADVKTDGGGYFEQDSSLDLHLKNIASGAVDIQQAELIRCYHGWFWPDRLTKMFDSGKIFGGKSTHMAVNADYLGTRTDTEWGCTHYIARVRATDANAKAQRTALAIPIQRSGFASVGVTEATVPVWLGVWANPADMVTLYKDGKSVHWLVLGGEIVNWTGVTLRVAGLHVTVLTPSGTILVDRECNYDFRKLDYDNHWPAAPPSTIAHAELPDEYTVFVDGIELPTKAEKGAGLVVRLVLNYQLPDGWCGSATRIDQATVAQQPPMLAPLKGSWYFHNGMTQLGFSPHAHYHERFSYDILQRDASGSSFSGPADKNASYYCYGEEVYAMEDGVVLGFDFTKPENNGKLHDHDKGENYVILGHDGGPTYTRRTRYVHCQPKVPPRPSNPGQPLAVGDTVQAGDLIGYVGNSGNSTEPHLHLDLWAIDGTGHPRPWPIRFTNLKAAGSNNPISGTPTNGDYEAT